MVYVRAILRPLLLTMYTLIHMYVCSSLRFAESQSTGPLKDCVGQVGYSIYILRLLINPNTFCIEEKLNSHMKEHIGQPCLPQRLDIKVWQIKRPPVVGIYLSDGEN